MNHFADQERLSAADRQRFPDLPRPEIPREGMHANRPRNPSPNDNLESVVTMVVTSGPHRGQRFQFNQHDTFVAGRSQNTHLSLPDDPRISRYHFRLEIRPPECYLVDLDSRNGTCVNETRVTDCFLKHDDVVSLGHTKIRVEIEKAELASDTSAAATVLTNRETQESGTTSGPSTSGSSGIGNWQPVPGYELVEKLGEGTMGTVYRAIQKSTAQRVAVKLIVPERAGCEQDIQLFLREASVLSRLDHPRIIKFRELGMAAGQFFFVMEEVPTVDFPSLLAQQTSESRVRICCGITCQILEALGYAHSLSIVHRDIKPANVLITRPGRKLKCKLADFGLAKNYANAGFSEITRDGEARGTIAFMPPEQLIDCRQAKPAADIYSVGATLYHYLAGEFPFEFSDDRSAFAQILQDEFVPLNHRLPEIPQELAAMVHRALARDPVDRFASAQEMRQSLLPFSKRRS